MAQKFRFYENGKKCSPIVNIKTYIGGEVEVECPVAPQTNVVGETAKDAKTVWAMAYLYYCRLGQWN